jgi:3-oxoadipate enol-lactonase
MPTLELSEGNTLNYELIEAKGDGATFVFFNALSGDKEMWTSAVGQSLQANGHGMLLYNLRGQAGSDTTQEQIDTQSIIEDAKALLNHVKPVRPIHVGLSIGGLFSLRAHLAGGHGRAAGIVLINTLRKDSPRLSWINDAVVRAAETGGFELMKDLYSPLLMNIEWQADNRDQFLANRPYTPCPPDDLALMLLKSGATADWGINYEAIDIPVLSISGLQDRVFYNAQDVIELSARMPQCESLDMADAGHMVPVERPAKLADALIEFAKRVC